MSGARTSARGGFAAWRRGRPFVGALLIAIAGVEMFFSTQLDIGALHIQLGIEGFQATVIPLGFVLLGALIVAMPQHRVFYGVLALALSLYSIVGVNLGGFLIGMLLSAVGGILVVSWAPRAVQAPVGATTLTVVTADATPAPASVTAPAPASVAVTASVAAPATADRGPHAEFAPYSSLVAIARAAELSRVPA